MPAVFVEYHSYEFVPSPNNARLAMCLFCEQVFSNEAMKPSSLKKHLTKIHPDKTDKEHQGSQREAWYEDYLHEEDQSVASYNIFLLIAKC